MEPKAARSTSENKASRNLRGSTEGLDFIAGSPAERNRSVFVRLLSAVLNRGGREGCPTLSRSLSRAGQRGLGRSKNLVYRGLRKNKVLDDESVNARAEI